MRLSPDALQPAALARDAQFRSLAALVVASGTNSLGALRELAKAAGHETALDWLLALDLSEQQWSEARQALPSTIPLSPLAERALTGLSKSALEAPASERAAAVARLIAAGPSSPGRIKAARTIARTGPATGVLHDAAFSVLAATNDPKDRPLLLRDATRQDVPLPERLQRLDALGGFTKPAERTAAEAMLTELGSFSGSVDAAVVGRNAARLDARWFTTWFYSPWPYSFERLATREFGEEMGRARLSGLVRDTMTPDQVSSVYAAADGLGWEDDAAVAVALVTAGHALPDGGARYLRGRDGSPAVQPVGWHVLLADASGRMIPAFAEAATPDTVSAAASAHADHPSAVRTFAGVTSQMSPRMSRPEPTSGRREPDADWITMVVDLTAKLGRPFLQALAPHFRGIVAPRAVLDLIADDEATERAYLEVGAVTEIVGHATGASAAARLLGRFSSDLGRDHIEALLAKVGTSDQQAWSNALSSVARSHADLVRERARDLIDGLAAPVQAHRPAPEVVASAVRVALTCGLADEVDEEALSRLGALLDSHRHPELVQVACDWATSLDPDEADLEAVVRAAVDADARRAVEHPGLTTLRAHLARVLVGRAYDPALPTAERADSLELAAESDVALTYSAAVDLAGSDDPDVNVAAARVLNRADVRAEDIPRLKAVLDAETDATARDLYSQALTRVHARAANDAIHRLLGLTEETASTAVVAAVAPRDGTDQADRLVHAVNDVLQTSNGSPPTAFVTAATALADELMFCAIDAATAAGQPIKGVDTKKIRDRDEGHPGGIAGRLPVQHQFPWVAHVLGLHDIRQAHVTKKGRTKPSPLTEKDRSNALTLLGMVLSGWLRSLHELQP